MKIKSIVAVMAAVFMGGVAALAQVPSDARTARAAPDVVTAVPAQPAAPILDKAELDDWLDGFLPYALSSGDIAGAVIVVVKDGRVLTERGYGHADIASGRKVDPLTTLFRPGSISKPFTWTAVMQLVEQGRIDLDADINQYLDFRIPPRDGKPITMRHLMTHTAGFEEHLKGLFLEDPARLQTLGEYLKTWTPRRVHPVGEVPAYSNYGSVIAGYIVERISGEPFDAYVERHIFGPLDMTRSTFLQPLPKRFEADMATAYMRASGRPKPYELISATPAGGLSTTGDDMGRFMIAVLQDGQYRDGRILRPETARSMYVEQKKFNPPLNAMALGYYREDRNGRPIIGHAGATEGFYSDMHLLIDDDVGIFISMNSAGRDGAASRILKALLHNFMDRYYPSTAVRMPTTQTAKTHAEAMAGYYWPSRRMDTTFFGMVKLLRQTRITARPDGTIQVDAIKNPAGAVKTWREIGPWLWEDETGSTRLAATVENGEVVNYATDGAPPVNVMQRVPVWAQAGWSKPALNLALLTLLVTLVLWPVQVVVRWRYGAAFALAGRRALLYRLVRIAALVALLGVAAAFQTLGKLSGGLTLLDDRVNGVMRLAQTLCLLGLSGIALALWNLALVWRDHAAGWWAKLSSLLLLLAFLTFGWFVVTLNILSLTTQF